MDNVFNALLYLETGNGKRRLPNIPEYIVSELVAALYEYILGEEYKENMRNYQFRGFGAWQHRVAADMEIIFSKDTRLNPLLKLALFDLTEYRFTYTPYDKGFNNTINRHWISMPRIAFESTAFLVQEQLRKGKKAIKELNPAIVNQIQEIAELMYKYAKRDIKEIKKYYYW
jgi:hypothetical protein